MNTPYHPRPIKIRTFKDIYKSNAGMQRYNRLERDHFPHPPNQGYRPMFGGSFERLLQSIHDAQAKLEQRHPKAELPTRQEVEQIYQNQNGQKECPKIEIEGRKYDIEVSNSCLRAEDEFDIIPFHHLETNEQRQERRERQKKEKKECFKEKMEKREADLEF